jgi:peptide/nickel transport system substrate-binding protein
MSAHHRHYYRRPSLSRISLSAALAAAILAGVAQAAETPRPGGTAVFIIGADPPSANPVLTSSSDVITVGCLVYQGLTTMLPDGSVKPLLAKSWTISPDGKTYTFELNHATWQDGQPFTSEDVQFSLLQANAKYNPVFAAAGRMIDSIDTPAPDKVVIHLKSEFGPFLLSLGCFHGGAILPAHIFKGTDIPSNPASISKPVGTGAYMISSWTRGDNIQFVKNPHYWEAGKPYLDKLIGKIITQPSDRVQALLSGDADFLTYFYLPVTDYAAVKANPDYQLTPSPTPPSQDILFLNVTHKPLDSKEVRHALMIATNRDYLMKSAFRNIGVVGTSPFPKQVPWWTDPNINYETMYPYDPVKAGSMLDELGLKRGADGTRFSVRFVYATDDAESAAVALAIKDMWRQIGVNVIIDASERTTTTKKMFIDRDFDLALTAYTSFYDPALGIARAFVTSSIGKPFGNPTGYSNPTVDDLFQKAATLTAQDQRGAIYRQLQVILADDLPEINLRDRLPMDASSKKLHGMEDENPGATWRNAWLDQ